MIEIGASDEGRALFLASICELIGHGQVLSLRRRGAATRPPHPRLRRPRRVAVDPETSAEHVHELVGSGNAVVVLGACADRATTVRQFEAYADLVGVGPTWWSPTPS